MSNHLPESFSLAPIWLSNKWATRKESASERWARDNPETNAITIKPDTASHAAEQFSWVPLPYCSPPGCPLPMKSLALSAHVSPWTIHFQVLDKSPLPGPERGPSSCNSRKDRIHAQGSERGPVSPRAKGSVEGEEASALGVGWAGGSRAHRPSLVGHGAELLLLPESRGKGLRGSEREGVTHLSLEMIPLATMWRVCATLGNGVK